MLTQARLKYLLHYDPETGAWTYAVSRGHLKVGSIAGTINKDGYRVLSVDYRYYRAGPLAFLYMLGRFPRVQIDHKDTNPSNDRWSNLREATYSQNGANKKKYSTNTSGVKGVSRKGNGWRAQATLNGEKHTFPTRETIDLAAADYAAFVAQKHGEFARVS